MDWANLTGVLHPSYTTSKVGGYGWNVQRNTSSPDQQPAEFIFQFVVLGDFPWLRGPGGTLCFAHSREENADSWWIDCKPSADAGGSNVMPVELGCEVEGLQISVHRPAGRHRRVGLAISYHDNTGRLYRLEDLCGLVHIMSGETALRFVRLRTCGLLRNREINEWEMFKQADFAALPDWCKAWAGRPSGGTHDQILRDTEALKRATVLDAQSLLDAGLAPAHVEGNEGEFRILRWTYTAPLPRKTDDTSNGIDRGFFRKIAEAVASNGACTYTVLEQRHAEEGEGVSWGELP